MKKISTILGKNICGEDTRRCFFILASTWSSIILFLCWLLWPELQNNHVGVVTESRIYSWRWSISLGFIWLLVLFSIGLGVRSVAGSFRALRRVRTEIVNNEQESSRQEALFEAIFNSITDAVVFTDKLKRIVMVNPAFTTLTGYTSQEVKGSELAFLFACLGGPPNNQGDAGQTAREMECCSKDGSVIPTETFVTHVQGSDGETIGHLMVLRDITLHKDAEKERSKFESQLRQSCKMEAIGTLACGIAHDFNNVLGIIFVNTDMALGDIPKGHPAAINVQRIVQASNRARALVQQIMVYSRQTDQKLIPLMPGSLVKESLQFLRSTTPAGVKIVQHLNDGFKAILMDPAQLQELLVTLFSNAALAVQDWGTIEVTGTVVELDECDVEEHHTAVQPGSYFKLSVSDTGGGMDQATQERMFDLFPPSREAGEGTGRGLAAVMSIVRSHRGHITMDSKPGSGTIIQVFFPIVGLEEDRKESTALLQGTERVLLVDDEYHLIDMAGMFLRRQGFVVTERTESLEALATFKSSPDAFDVIVTDQTMPEMTGSELAVEVLKIRPDIPILLLSGHGKKMSREEVRKLGIREFLYKPFDGKTLVRSIRKILDENALA